MKRFSSLVKSDLIRNLQIQHKLADAVYELLGLDRAQHRIWVVTQRNQLTLLTDHPILATQLQYQQESIKKTLNRKFLLELNQVKVKIAPPRSLFRKKEKEERFVVTEKSAAALESVARMIDDDELADVLLRLGRPRNKTKK